MSQLTTNLRKYLYEDSKKTLEDRLQESLAECTKNDNARNCEACIYNNCPDCLTMLLKDMQIYLNSYIKH